MGVFGRNIYFVGANDERAQKRIQGSTLAMTYVDEITNIPEGVFKMLLSRLSVPGAKLFGTTNPDSPFHWLKVQYLDRHEELDISRWSFRLDDNPSLTKEYLDALKREYTGLWGRRYVDGEWVVASGLIYDMFDESCIINYEPSASKYVVGVDYGTNAPCAFVLIGYNPAAFPHYWIEKEYYWDSKTHQRQKTDSEYGDDFVNFCNGRIIESIVVDPSAASFKTELQVTHNLHNIINGNNDVLPGIRTVSTLFSTGDLKVHRRCSNLIRELGSYRWDERGLNAGNDVVFKANDHLCFVAGTMIATITGERPIEDLKVGDLVFTRDGYKRVIACMAREADDIWELKTPFASLVGTGNHPIWQNERHIALKDLNGNHELCLLRCEITEHMNTKMSMSHECIPCESSPYIESKAVVYNIEVEETHHYFANGIYVSNCDAARYALMHLHKPYSEEGPSIAELNRKNIYRY